MRPDVQLAARAGISLKAVHVAAILDTRPDAGWFEVHAENYMGAGGSPHHQLTAVCEHYPVSVHGVGLSLGSDRPPDPAHLARLRALVDRYQPTLVSEHLAWAGHGGAYFNDLLPLPLTREALDRVADNIARTQDALGRTILIENPSVYVGFALADYDEPEFLNTLARRTGCGLLLDVNNAYVSACNTGVNARRYLQAVDGTAVGEIHLAGHAVDRSAGLELRIDDHGCAVDPAVWALYHSVIARIGPRPTLIEWDTRVPALEVLLAEAASAQAHLDAVAEECPRALAG